MFTEVFLIILQVNNDIMTLHFYMFFCLPSYLDIFLFLFSVYVSDRVEMSHVSIYGRLFHKYLRIPYGSISEAGEFGLCNM